MRVPFRQGIVSAPDNFLVLNNRHVSINLQDSAGRVDIIFADGSTNYMVSETRSVNNAWIGAFIPGIDYWLYWDIEPTSGIVTRGHTLVEPVSGNSPPTSPSNNTHWFDTQRGQMFVYQSTTDKWIHVIRTFACQLYNGTHIISMSANSPSFVGTQVGDIGDALAGALVFDINGNALKRADGKFFTTEDTIVAGVGNAARIRMETALVSAKAAASIPAYSLVRFIDVGEIVPATNLMLNPGIYGLVDHDVAEGELTEIIREGYITNHTGSWDFNNVPINTAVFVNSSGQLTLTPQAGGRAVGMVMGVDSIVLLSTTVADVTLLQSAVTITGPTSGVTVTSIGGQGQTSGHFNIALGGNLSAINNISTNGFARRVNNSLWTTSNINLATDTVGVLPVLSGGTGTGTLGEGYVFAPGAGGALTTTPSIPGSAVSGDIAGKSDNVNGVVGITNGGTGADTRAHALNNLLPQQTTAGMVLSTNGSEASWTTIPDGTVRSIGIVTGHGLSAANTPVVSAGNINLSLTGNVLALANLMTSGLVSRTAGGLVQTNTISAPRNSLVINNGDAAISGNISIDLPVLNAPAVYASVVTDEYGRVTTGQPTLDWSRLDNAPQTVAGYGILDAYTKSETDALTWNWSQITQLPSTMAGYGITDAYTKSETDALTWDWSRINATPTSLVGYGITDAVINGGGVYDLTLGSSINKPQAGIAGRVYIDTTDYTLSVDNGSTWSHIGNIGTVTSVNVDSLTSDLTISGGPVTTTGTMSIGVAGNLAAVSSLSTPGLVVRGTNGTWQTSYVVGMTNNTTIINGDGNGNIVVDLANIGTAGTYLSVTTDSKGRVISGSQTADWSAVVNTPTTNAGYGITDSVTTSMMAAPLGVATLDAIGKIPQSQLPAIAITDTYVVNSQSEMLSLVAQVGDIAVRLDENKTYVLTNSNQSLLTSWQEILSSVAGGGVGVTHVNAQSNNSNLVITGGPILDSGTLQFSLTGNLGGISGVSGTGALKRDGGGNWTVSAVSATELVDVVSVSNGGTGAIGLTGYIRGNGTNPMTSMATIPGSDIVGDIIGNSVNVTGVVSLSNGGTGATTQADALANILPLQTSPAVLSTDGTVASWQVAIPGSMISGAVANASQALNADALGGQPLSYFQASDGTGAHGVWSIDINGSATELGGRPASDYALVNGTNATGTWDINITGNAALLGGKSSNEYALADGTNTTGVWSVNTSGTASNVTGTVAIANGGTGATTQAAALSNILPPQTGQANKVLTTNGTNATWANPQSSSSSVTSVIVSSALDTICDDTHLGAYVRLDNGDAQTYTVPSDTAIPLFGIGSFVTVRQVGDGQVNIQPAPGVTINSVGTLTLRTKHSSVQLLKVGVDEWDIIGDVAL